MPKVSDAYRKARREEIALAAMRCLSRQGFAGTSMADIIAESGMSAGAIYSHFASKAEIALHVARLVVGTRADELRAFTESADHPVGPDEIIAFMVGAMDRVDMRRSLLLQIWAEATVDPELHSMLNETVSTLRSAYAAAVEPWLRAKGQPRGDSAALRAADTMVVLTQGLIVNTALFGERDPIGYVAGIRALLG